MYLPPRQRVRKSLAITTGVSVLSVAIIAWGTPLALLLALVPLAYTIPLLVWLDQLEPEPRAMRWNAFLWGAGISTIVASVANEVTSSVAGSSVALVISAPVSEELMKVLGISGAAKRHHID